MSRVDTRNRYVPVRLGELNTQTRWVLEQARAQEPEFLPHVMLRVRDVMREDFPQADDSEPVREVGRLMARQDLDLVPIVNTAGALTGVMTERALARRYIRESREPSELDAPTNVSAIVKVLQGEVLAGSDNEVSGQIWCMAMDVGALPTEIGPGDVVVVGNRDDAQRAAIDLGVGLLVVSNGAQPEPGDGRPGAGPRRAGRHLAAGQLRHRAHDHPVGAVPRADGPEPADRPARRPALGRRRRGQGSALPRGGRRGRAPAPDRARHPHRSRLPAAAPRAARRSRRAGAERAGRRAGRDRRDPRPPPHRLDRDHGARCGPRSTRSAPPRRS